MKRFTCILLLFVGVLAQAQVRTYSENASKTFVVGLDSYFYGEAGSLSFEAAGRSFQASVGADGVFIGDRKLGGGGDVVIGIHDFTGNRVPEFVLAQRVGESIGIWVYALNDGSWNALKMMSVRGAKEVAHLPPGNLCAPGRSAVLLDLARGQIRLQGLRRLRGTYFSLT